MSPAFTHLVLSGGGMAALCYFGALRFLEVEQCLKSVKNIASTSMGSIFAVALALKIPLTDLEHQLLEVIQDCSKNELRYPNLVSCINKLGAEDVRRYVDVLRPYTKNLTFLELSKRSGINLVICATQIPSMEPVFFSVDSSPNVLVYDALRASVSIPWIFEPVVIGDSMYVDGGVTANVPYEPFEGVPPSSVIVLHTMPMQMPHHDTTTTTIIDPLIYTVCLVTRFMLQTAPVKYLRSRFPHYVLFDNPPLGLLPMSFQTSCARLKVTKEDIDMCLAYGYRVAFDALRPALVTCHCPEPSQTEQGHLTCAPCQTQRPCHPL